MSTSYSRCDMLRHPIELTILNCALLILVACTKSQARADGALSSTTTAAADATDGDAENGDTPFDCNKLFTPEDAVGILAKQAVVAADQFRKRSCTIGIPNGGSIQISTGSDRDSEMSWNDAANSSDSVNITDLPGVGDKARYRTSTGGDVYSRKGKMYCSAGLLGLADPQGDFTATRGLALATKRGALCSKVYAAK